MRKFWFCVLLLLAGPSQAYDGATSELSHAAGGALLAGMVTRVYSESENRAWIGFAVSAAVSVLAESYQVSRGAASSSSMLDVAAHTAGAALGAWVTDRYILVPVVSRTYAGVMFQRKF